MRAKYRNWIEAALKREIVRAPIKVGWRGGRRVYEVMFTDYTTKDYYIDFYNRTIEEV